MVPLLASCFFCSPRFFLEGVAGVFGLRFNGEVTLAFAFALAFGFGLVPEPGGEPDFIGLGVLAIALEFLDFLALFPLDGSTAFDGLFPCLLYHLLVDGLL